MGKTMNIIEIRNTLNKIIEDGYGDLEFECSVDMSVDGDETTYPHRVFGREPFCVRAYYSPIEAKDIVQILFEKGEDNKDRLK